MTGAASRGLYEAMVTIAHAAGSVDRGRLGPDDTDTLNDALTLAAGAMQSTVAKWLVSQAATVLCGELSDSEREQIERVFTETGDMSAALACLGDQFRRGLVTGFVFGSISVTRGAVAMPEDALLAVVDPDALLEAASAVRRVADRQQPIVPNKNRPPA